ncbi:hypothetical protein RJ639_021824 [Escallonia herrerae]|uniref:Reverse transcriptase/retrotransposon-derived protein RNase H-like domain-containing protein n=1 Tax=Escallonia herrerae TaxID=1293975 RepID=A0AA89AH06_9ASTE|nr:hypothetical protein RJ639_021824 [Escallonia herrerae]
MDSYVALGSYYSPKVGKTQRIKDYLMKLPVLMALVKGKPVILYMAAMDTFLGALLAQHNDQGKENALCYLSRTLIGAELRYTTMEKVKGQALADFLEAHLVPDDSLLVLDLPDEEIMQTKIKKMWEMYFNGASRSLDGEKQNDPKNNQYEGCSNNEAEYEAIITGLELSLEIRLAELESLDGNRLIAQQSLEMYQQRMENAFDKRVKLRSFKKEDSSANRSHSKDQRKTGV